MKNHRVVLRIVKRGTVVHRFKTVVCQVVSFVLTIQFGVGPCEPTLAYAKETQHNQAIVDHVQGVSLPGSAALPSDLSIAALQQQLQLSEQNVADMQTLLAFSKALGEALQNEERGFLRQDLQQSLHALQKEIDPLLQAVKDRLAAHPDASKGLADLLLALQDLSGLSPAELQRRLAAAPQAPLPLMTSAAPGGFPASSLDDFKKGLGQQAAFLRQYQDKTHPSRFDLSRFFQDVQAQLQDLDRSDPVLPPSSSTGAVLVPVSFLDEGGMIRNTVAPEAVPPSIVGDLKEQGASNGVIPLDRPKPGKTYFPYLNVKGRQASKSDVSDTKVSGTYDVFLPIVELSDHRGVLFTDLRINTPSRDLFEVGLNVGFRRILSEDKAFGIYGYGDANIDEGQNRFNRMGVGAEYWWKKLYVGGNLYVPVGTRERKDFLFKTLEHFTKGTARWGIERSFYHAETGLAGVEGEIGYAFTDKLTGYVGGYYSEPVRWMQTVTQKSALRTSVAYRYDEPLLNIFDGASVELGATLPDHQRPTGFLQIGFTFGAPTKPANKVEPTRDDSPDVRNLNRHHMTDLVRRSSPITAEESRNLVKRQQKDWLYYARRVQVEEEDWIPFISFVAFYVANMAKVIPAQCLLPCIIAYGIGVLLPTAIWAWGWR